MAYYALHLEDGRLVGVTNEEPVALGGVSIKEIQSPQLESSVWDTELLDFVRTSSVYSKLEFMNRFTAEERVAARLSTDPVVQDILNLLTLAEYVNVSDQNTVSGVNYMVTAGIITSERASEILQ